MFLFSVFYDVWHIGRLAGQKETALPGVANKQLACEHTFHMYTNQFGVHPTYHLLISPALKSTQGQVPGKSR